MDINVLECRRFIAPSAKSIIKRIVTDYELDFHIKGERIINIDKRECKVKAGDICFRRPGQEVYSFGDYDCYLLTLDFSGKELSNQYSRNAVNPMQPICNDSIVAFLPDIISPDCINEFDLLFTELSQQTDLSSEYSKNVAKQILFLLNTQVLRQKIEKQTDTELSVDRIYKYINENFLKTITLNQLSQFVHLDKTYLSRLFKNKFGVSPIDYVIYLRLDHARNLLLSTNMTVADISACCAYKNISFFISCYKKKYGLTPAEHRKQMWRKNK